MWWVITSIDMIPEIDALLVYAYTSQDDHLFMSWSYYKPSRTPIYRVVRGTKKFCGFKYIWDTPNLAEQIEFGDTPDHLFYLIDLKPSHVIWFYLWAPDGPYGLQIQGPLMHASLPWLPPPWARIAYVATKAKGMFKTRDFSGPGNGQPTWVPDNAGMDVLTIRQACPDLYDPYHRRYVYAGLDIYRMDNVLVELPAHATKILSCQEALTLTGLHSGKPVWVATIAKAPGVVLVLFWGGVVTYETWLLRSYNYGATWDANLIVSGANYNVVGNLMAGRTTGYLGYGAGSVMYAVAQCPPGNSMGIYRSIDLGSTWNLMDVKGYKTRTPRCLVDPTTQGTVYMGAWIDVTHPLELYRSTAYGADLAEADGAHHLGIFTDHYEGELWVNRLNNFQAKILRDDHIWETTNYCASWTDHGAIQYPRDRLAIISEHPTHLYLASREQVWLPGPGEYAPTICVSDDHGITLYPKAGDHADQSDGGGDSIPYGCGGVAHEGILLTP